MIYRGDYKLAWQHDDAVQYAEVAIELESPGNASLDLQNVPELWRTAVAFGIQLARTSFAQIISPNANLRITDFKWKPSDTTLMAVAFSIFNALLNALKIKDENFFSFNPSTGEYRIKYPMK